MITFFIGIAILLAGGAIYGRICERVFKPDDRETPAVRLNDGVDYVPMKKWQNALIQFLNIAGTGPILGPIQGILFGPVAFITIPIGCFLGGALHDYMSGMISMRCDGEQPPQLIRRFMGKKVYSLFNIFVCLLLLLVGAVFIYTPGDLFITQIMKQESSLGNPVLWIVYAAIFVYYLIASIVPIDKIIGKIYPIFGGILILSGLGVFVGLLVKGYPLVIFVLVAVLLIFSKSNPDGFSILWRYFAWGNQTIAVFIFAMISIYMIIHKMPYFMALIPGMFYMFVISSFILNAKIGFGLNWIISYTVAGVLTAAYAAAIMICGKKKKAAALSGDSNAAHSPE